MEHKKTTTKIRAKGNYGIKSWDEKAWDGKDPKDQLGDKLTHAKVIHTFTGDFEDDGTVEMLMAYHGENATYVGLQLMKGRLGNRSGSFIVQISGAFEKGAARSDWTVIPGSGTGELQGILGKGETIAHMATHSRSRLTIVLNRRYCILCGASPFN